MGPTSCEVPTTFAPGAGLEPATYGLTVRRATSCATPEWARQRVQRVRYRPRNDDVTAFGTYGGGCARRGHLDRTSCSRDGTYAPRSPRHARLDGQSVQSSSQRGRGISGRTLPPWVTVGSARRTRMAPERAQ